MSESYTVREDKFTKPETIGFLENWATTNEIIVKGLEYNVESIDKDSYNGLEAKSVTKVVSQDENKTILISKLYIKDTNKEDNEYVLDLKQHVTIEHYDSIENIKNEYAKDLNSFSFLKNMIITNYNYNLICETEDYDEFGLVREELEDKRYRKVTLCRQFDDNLTILEVKNQIEDVLHYVTESLKDFENMFYSWHRFFDCDGNLSCEITIYQIIK